VQGHKIELTVQDIYFSIGLLVGLMGLDLGSTLSS